MTSREVLGKQEISSDNDSSVNRFIGKELVLKALTVAILVGSILLLINKYDAIFGDEYLRIIPAILTYCVPFVVLMAGDLSRSRR